MMSSRLRFFGTSAAIPAAAADAAAKAPDAFAVPVDRKGSNSTIHLWILVRVAQIPGSETLSE